MLPKDEISSPDETHAGPGSGYQDTRVEDGSLKRR